VHAAADCVTVRVWPATVTVPARLAVAVFAATFNVTVPPPLPLAGLTVIHVAALVAVQVQPVAVVTVAEAVPPAATTDAVVVGATE
jgi:hypothetical protein